MASYPGRKKEEMKKNIERNDKGYASVTFCAGAHGHIKTRVWVHRTLVEPGEHPGVETLTFPVRGARIARTDKGALVLRPAPGAVVYHVAIPSGYRGTARIDTIAGGEIIASGSAYHSGQGSLGDTAWALVNASGPIEVRGTRTGRRIDNPAVAYTVTPDGTETEIVEDAIAELLA